MSADITFPSRGGSEVILTHLIQTIYSFCMKIALEFATLSK